MRIRRLAVVFLLGAGLGSCAERQCDPAKLLGTYLVHYNERAGNCGPIPDAVVNGAAASVSLSSCTLLFSETSDDKCSSSSAARCPLTSGGTMTTSSSLDFVEDNGSKLEGELTVTLLGPTGITTCSSTYDVTYTRQ